MLAAEMKQRKKAEDKFRGLLEAAPDAMVITNEKGEIVLINRQTEKLFGYRKEELIGKPVEILIPPDFHSKHITDRSKYFADPKVRSMGVGLELFAIRKDGIQFPVEISLSPLITEEGTLISASVRDITERKKAEDKLKKAKKRFSIISKQRKRLRHFHVGQEWLCGKLEYRSRTYKRIYSRRDHWPTTGCFLHCRRKKKWGTTKKSANGIATRAL